MYLYNIAPERERQGACRRITERHSIGHEGRRVGRRVTVTDVTPHLFQAALPDLSHVMAGGYGPVAMPAVTPASAPRPLTAACWRFLLAPDGTHGVLINRTSWTESDPNLDLELGGNVAASG